MMRQYYTTYRHADGERKDDFINTEETEMTPKEVVLRGYQLFAEGDVNGLEKINHETALFMVNGEYKRSGEYKGFADFRDNFLAHLPNDFPNSI